MRIKHASGNTPLAIAAQLHEAASNARTCCEEHARADVAFPAPGECRAPGDTDEHRHKRMVSSLLEAAKGTHQMAVRGKFIVTKVAQLHWSKDAREISFNAVHDQSTPENARYSKATPSGTITMVVDSPPAAEQLVIGKTFYVDFTEAAE